MATRIERVVLELDDNLTTGMAKAAAATALLKRELGGVSGESVGASRSTRALGNDVERTGSQASKANAELNSYSGRIKLIAQLAAGLGPALVPIGAVGIPAVAGLANELTGVALAGGTALLAFHNIGSTLTKLNKAALEPTDTNLQNAKIALSELPPAARKFALELQKLEPTLLRLRQAAAAGLFPGLEDALTELHKRSGDVEKILFRVGSELGDLSRRGAEALSGPEWDDFFKFVSREAPLALEGLGRSVGSVVHGLAQLWMAFAPLNHNFTNVIIDAADGFDRWATGLAKTEGFTDFIAYLRTNGPLVADAVGAIANAVLKIVEAAAPLGGPILVALTGIANAIGTIADSPAGPTILATVTALSLLSRGQATFGRISSASWVQAIRSAETYSAKVAAVRGPAIRGALALAGVGLAASGAADKFGLANTATLALTGSLAGPWGAAAGGAVGLLLDLSNKSDQFKLSSQDVTDTLNKQTGAITQNTRAYVAQQFQQQGILDAASRLGVNLRDVTSAALGNEAALARVTQAVKDYQAAAAAPQVVGQDAHGNDVRVAAPVSPDDAAAVDALNGAISTTSSTIHTAKGDVVQLNLAVGGMSGAFNDGRTAAERFRGEIERVSETLTKRSSLRSYHQAILDFQTALKENGATLDQNTQKGIDNQAALDGIASSAIAVAQTLKGAEQRRFLVQAKKDFLDAAHDLGIADGRAQDLADNLFKLNKIVAKPKVFVDGIPQSLAKLEAVSARLAALRRQADQALTLHFTGGRVPGGQADGGTVHGPAGPYGDRVLTMLAPGEEVISNRHGQATQHRALLKAINDRRYADGGTVAQSRVSVNVAGATTVRGGTDIDYGQLASAMSAMRPAPPLYGDVHITGDPSAYKRQMEQDRAMANLSGARSG